MQNTSYIAHSFLYSCGLLLIFIYLVDVFLAGDFLAATFLLAAGFFNPKDLAEAVTVRGLVARAAVFGFALAATLGLAFVATLGFAFARTVVVRAPVLRAAEGRVAAFVEVVFLFIISPFLFTLFGFFEIFS
jgi:hypothetical protein